MSSAISVKTDSGWQRLTFNADALQIVKINNMLTFGEYALTRTTTIKVSKAANLHIFGDAGIVQAVGYGARRRYVARLLSGMTQSDGELLVQSVSGDDVECVFIETQQELQALAAVQWSDIASDQRASIATGQSSYVSELWAVRSYQNANGKVHLPSIGFAALCSAMSAVAGVRVSVPSALRSWRLVANSANYPKQYSDTWRRQQPISQISSNLFPRAIVQISGQSVDMLEMNYSHAELRFATSTPDNFRLVVLTAANEPIMQGNSSLAGRIIDIEGVATTQTTHGTYFGLMKYVDGALQPLTAADEFAIAVEISIKSEPNINDWLASVYMADNLPSFTPFELLKYAALTAGMWLKASGGEIYFNAIEVGEEYALLKRAEMSRQIRRTFGSWSAVDNQIAWAKSSDDVPATAITYSVDNSTLSATGKVADVPFAIAGNSAGIAHIDDTDVDEDGKVSVKSKAPTIATQVGNVLQFVEPQQIALASQLCSISTNCKLQVAMSGGLFSQLTEQMTIIYSGKQWCWLSCVYQPDKHTAEIELQRLN